MEAHSLGGTTKSRGGFVPAVGALAVPALLSTPLSLQDYNIDEEAALQAALALSLSEN